MDTFGSEVKMLLFDILCDNINKSQFNIVKLDVLSGSKNQGLEAQTSKGKHKT